MEVDRTTHASGADALPEGEEAPPPGVRTMGIVRWALVGLMALAAVAAWVHPLGIAPRSVRAAAQYQCPMHPSIITAQPGACPICGMDLVRIDEKSSSSAASTKGPSAAAGASARNGGPGAYWCPMHPEVTSNDPEAVCEKCGGMKLVPRPKEPASAVPGLVRIDLTPERIQLIGMRTAQVTREQLWPTLRTVGFVTADEGGIAIVAARFPGWIEQLLVTQSGTYVKKGQPLVRIYSPDLIAAQQAYLNAIRWESEKSTAPSQGTSLIERDARARLQLTGMSDEDVNELARTRQPMRALFARSPIGGYVGRKTAVTGLYVQPGAELFEIADLSTVWVIADVYESEIDRVRVGQKATITVPAVSGLHFAGQVSFVYPAVSAGSRTLQVRIAVKNPGLRLRPGMFANVTLDLGAVAGLVVPSEAVVDTGEYQYLFVARQGGRFEPRQLRLGSRGEGKVQVLEGVTEGETVVTTANFLVDSESRLRAAIEGFAGGRAPPTHDTTQHPRGSNEHEQREAPAHEAGEHGVGATSGDEPGPSAPRARAK